MKTIRILHTSDITTETAQEAFTDNFYGYVYAVTSLGAGASPIHFIRYPIIVLVDWSDTDAIPFAGQFGLSTIVLEVEDKQADEILTQLTKRSRHFAS